MSFDFDIEDEKFDVKIDDMPKYGKRWVLVTIWSRFQWIPSFRDLFRVIQAICVCEDEKYPGGEGRGMVRRLLADACENGATWETLQEKYKIPRR